MGISSYPNHRISFSLWARERLLPKRIDTSACICTRVCTHTLSLCLPYHSRTTRCWSVSISLKDNAIKLWLGRVFRERNILSWVFQVVEDYLSLHQNFYLHNLEWKSFPASQTMDNIIPGPLLEISRGALPRKLARWINSPGHFYNTVYFPK